MNDEPDRVKNEGRHPVKLTRSFALLDREITLEELIAFSPLYTRFMRQYDAKPADAGFGADWYDAVGFCRWLGQQSGFQPPAWGFSDRGPDSNDLQGIWNRSTGSHGWDGTVDHLRPASAVPS